jgi:peptidoglycan pentaglycine glycine transferase (the first glycine)
MDTPPSIDRLRSDDPSWDAFVRSAPTGSYLQLSGWAEVKAANGWRARRVVAEAGSGPVGIQLLMRRLGPTPFGIGYAPRGPVGASDPDSLRALSDLLAAVAHQERLSHVTMDPGWAMPVPSGAAATTAPGVSTASASDDHTWTVSPVSGLLAAGWRHSDDLQHDRTRIVDLDDADQMWSAVRSRTQRYIKSARKGGIAIAREGPEAMEDFHRLLVATAERAGFIYRDAESYRRILQTFEADGAHLLMARTPVGRAVAGLLIVRCGDTVAEPSGGMDDEGAETRANYLLKWEAMAEAAAAGARHYDMWGIAHGGIDQFKAGFGGREVRYPGAFDLQTMPLLRPGILAARRAWVGLARRRRGLVAHSTRPTGGPAAAAEAGG